MPDDIVEIKPGLAGFRVNIRALIRRLIRTAKADPASAVAYRFLQLFQDHGVPIPQIQRLIPEVTLDKLRSAETLLPALTGAVLEQAASLFRVRRTWLERGTLPIYERLWCYKNPRGFFEDFARAKTQDLHYPIRALFSTKTLDSNDPNEQPLALILVEKLGELDDEEVLRYQVYGDDWGWEHGVCRIQLKAMARLVDKLLSNRIPLYPTNRKTLNKIREGEMVPPRSLFRRPSEDISLEDFALNSRESRRSKDEEELPTVLDYIRNNNLEDLAKQAWKRSPQ